VTLINDDQRRRHSQASLRLVFIASGLLCTLVLILPLVLPAISGFPVGLFLSVVGVVVGVIFVTFWTAVRQDKLDRRYGFTSEF
jgi:putative solute:sodium symporter small subunit